MASLAITLAVVVVVQLVAKLIEKALDLVAMGFVNKLAGAVFGLAKMWLILSFVILLVTSVTGSRSGFPTKAGQRLARTCGSGGAHAGPQPRREGPSGAGPQRTPRA